MVQTAEEIAFALEMRVRFINRKDFMNDQVLIKNYLTGMTPSFFFFFNIEPCVY